jgi:membrane protein
VNVKESAGLLKETYVQWSAHKSARLAAALAYYTIFAMAPLLIIAIAIAGLVFGHGAASHQILGQIGGLIGQKGEQQLATMVSASDRPATGVIAAILGVITLIFGASGVVLQLQDAIDVVWDVQEQPGGGIWQTVRTRILSITMLLALVFLLIVSLIVGAALTALNTYSTALMPSFTYIARAINLLFDLGILTLLFAVIFKYLPKTPVRWSDVRVGAFITAILFVIGQFGIMLYLGKTNASSPYGDAGALIIILLWVYYSAQLLLFGAEFTNVWAKRRGLAPSKAAKPAHRAPRRKAASKA